MLIKANRLIKMCIAALKCYFILTNKTNKQKRKRKCGHSLKVFYFKETQSYEYIFCIVCKDRM